MVHLRNKVEVLVAGREKEAPSTSLHMGESGMMPTVPGHKDLSVVMVVLLKEVLLVEVME
jgi:hypothetical protein